MPIYEYKCKNENCSNYDETIDRLAKVADRDDQLCSECESKLNRLQSVGGGTHTSWSLWRVGIGLDK
jgi:putative FmdB family regulatory protein